MKPRRKLTLSTRDKGFGLVELLVVVVILGLLAAIAIPIFMNQQTAAKNAASQQSLNEIYKAINSAKVKTGKTLIEITGATCSACVFVPSPGTAATPAMDPLNKPKTDASWQAYYTTLNRISTASGINVTNLVDGHGRPFVIDENEGENGTSCNRDTLGVFKDSPFMSWGSLEYSKPIPNYTKACA